MTNEREAVERVERLFDYLDALGEPGFVVGGREIGTSDLRTLLALAKRSMDQDPGKVERVARAICAATGANPDAKIPDGSCAYFWEAHVPAAIAALTGEK